MAASRKKKRAQPRANVQFKAKKRTGAPPGLTRLDAEWRSFIEQSSDDKPLSDAWPDPKASPSRPRKGAGKKAAKKKASPKAKKSATKKTARKKKATRK